ncbi:hypothetical protein ACQ4PT_052162 [Festuca glaucescens]
MDLQKCAMEGLVPGNRVDQFRDQLKEGSVYLIEKFDLYDPRKSYRSVDHPLRIRFTLRTILTNFPMSRHTALPFSMLSDRIDWNVLLSGVVGLVNKVQDVLPSSGNARSQKWQIYITYGSVHAIATLWGEQAILFDVDGLMDASNEEPIIILYVGMTISLLAFKSISVTRWHVNVPIPEIAGFRERLKHMLWRIELHCGKWKPRSC